MLNLNLCSLGTSAKPKLRDILQNNWTVVFENIKVMNCEDKEKPFNSPSWVGRAENLGRTTWLDFAR